MRRDRIVSELGRVMLFLLLCRMAVAGEVTLAVRVSPDPTGKYPHSRLYAAVLANSTRSVVALTAVQMPGGYVGSGTFFKCSIEQWDPSGKVWRIIHRVNLESYLATNSKTIRVESGQSKEVCREMLPGDISQVGSRLRFRLDSSWKPDAQTWVSPTFSLVADHK